MISKSRCILLYNPISGHGHLDSWLVLFIELYIERNFRVLVLTPDSNAISKSLLQKRLDGHPLLQILHWKRVNIRQSYFSKILEWWNLFGGRYFYGKEESKITPEMPLSIRIKKSFYRMIVPPMFFMSNVLRALFRKILPKHESPEEAGLDPVEMAIRVISALENSRWKPDFIFNMYMDMYKTGNHWDRYESICKIPWAGIRFVPQIEPFERYYALNSLRGMCFLDESISQSYSQHFSRKCFPFLPDITDASLPHEQPIFVKDILKKANGRKIVFLGGSIGGQKNIARWCEVISIADPDKWYFVQVGEIHANTFTQDDTKAFSRLLSLQPENFYLMSEYIRDECDFNALIKSSDILYAVYRNFCFSSNMLGKSAFLEVPILVSDKFLMGERVRKYGIGLTVNEDDSDAILAGLERLVLRQIDKQKYSAYRKDFDIKNLWQNISVFFEEKDSR